MQRIKQADLVIPAFARSEPLVKIA